jgi:hypothetical protein
VELFLNLFEIEIDDNINQALSNNRAEFLKQEKQKIYEGNSYQVDVTNILELYDILC